MLVRAEMSADLFVPGKDVGARRRQGQHHRAATVGAHRKPAAHDFAQGGEVRPHPKALLGAAAGHAESRHHLIKDQERTVLVTRGAQGRMKVGIRADEPGIPDVRLDDDRRDPAPVHAK